VLAELRAVLSELADGAHGEAGCISFRVLSGDDPGEFVLLASWTSEEALRKHYATAHYRYYREQVGPLLTRPSDVVVHHLAARHQTVQPRLVSLIRQRKRETESRQFAQRPAGKATKHRPCDFRGAVADVQHFSSLPRVV
jgi:quinol monooxygenase YgiN